MSATRIGCLACNTVMDLLDGPLCECDNELVALPTAVELLAFKLRCAGRMDEAVDVEDARAILGEHHA